MKSIKLTFILTEFPLQRAPNNIKNWRNDVVVKISWRWYILFGTFSIWYGFSFITTFGSGLWHNWYISYLTKNLEIEIKPCLWIDEYLEIGSSNISKSKPLLKDFN